MHSSSSFSVSREPILAQVKHVPGIRNWLQNDQILYLPCSVFLCTVTTLQLPSLGSRVWAGPMTGFDLSNTAVKLCAHSSRAFAHSYLLSWDLCLLPVDKWLAFWRMRAHNDQSHVCLATPQIWQSPARSANSTCSWPITRKRAQSGHLNCHPED